MGSPRRGYGLRERVSAERRSRHGCEHGTTPHSRRQLPRRAAIAHGEVLRRCPSCGTRSTCSSPGHRRRSPLDRRSRRGDLPQGTDRRRADSRFLSPHDAVPRDRRGRRRARGRRVGAAFVGFVCWSGPGSTRRAGCSCCSPSGSPQAVRCSAASSPSRASSGSRSRGRSRSRTNPRVRSGSRSSRRSTTPTELASRTHALEIVPDPEPLRHSLTTFGRVAPGGTLPHHEPRRGPVTPAPVGEELDIRRVRRGKGFSYHDAGGSRITDAATLERIRGIVIPPAWTDVRISDDPDSHLQAVGRDARGRLQYRYHPDWTTFRDRVKFDHLPAFANVLPVGAQAHRRRSLVARRPARQGAGDRRGAVADDAHPGRERGVRARQRRLRADHVPEPSREGLGLRDRLRVHGQERHHPRGPCPRPARRQSAPRLPGDPRSAAVPVPRRRRRAHARALARRERLPARDRRRRHHRQGLPHLGRHRGHCRARSALSIRRARRRRSAPWSRRSSRRSPPISATRPRCVAPPTCTRDVLETFSTGVLHDVWSNTPPRKARLTPDERRTHALLGRRAAEAQPRRTHFVARADVSNVRMRERTLCLTSERRWS